MMPASAIISTVRSLALVAVVSIFAIAPAQAQTYLHYVCRGGAEFEAAFFEGTRAAFVQVDGKSLNLPKRISATGSRYAKDGVTFWVKGRRATLKRLGKTLECTAK
jgi:membrane-bound inhibitor of C-type lysozyme